MLPFAMKKLRYLLPVFALLLIFAFPQESKAATYEKRNIATYYAQWMNENPGNLYRNRFLDSGNFSRFTEWIYFQYPYTSSQTALLVSKPSVLYHPIKIEHMLNSNGNWVWRVYMDCYLETDSNINFRYNSANLQYSLDSATWYVDFADNYNIGAIGLSNERLAELCTTDVITTEYVSYYDFCYSIGYDLTSFHAYIPNGELVYKNPTLPGNSFSITSVDNKGNSRNDVYAWSPILGVKDGYSQFLWKLADGRYYFYSVQHAPSSYVDNRGYLPFAYFVGDNQAFQTNALKVGTSYVAGLLYPYSATNIYGEQFSFCLANADLRGGRTITDIVGIRVYDYSDGFTTINDIIKEIYFVEDVPDVPEFGLGSVQGVKVKAISTDRDTAGATMYFEHITYEFKWDKFTTTGFDLTSTNKAGVEYYLDGDGREVRNTRQKTTNLYAIIDIKQLEADSEILKWLLQNNNHQVTWNIYMRPYVQIGNTFEYGYWTKAEQSASIFYEEEKPISYKGGNQSLIIQYNDNDVVMNISTEYYNNYEGDTVTNITNEIINEVPDSQNTPIGIDWSEVPTNALMELLMKFLGFIVTLFSKLWDAISGLFAFLPSWASVFVGTCVVAVPVIIILGILL